MATPTYSLSLDEFRRYAKEGNLIPLYREILADYETPVSAFATIDHGPSAYLLESVQGRGTRSSAADRRFSWWRIAAIC
jgi:anthranilate synthase component 1